MSVHASQWEYLLRLFGLIVMVDNKVYQEEVEAFIDAAMRLQKTVSPNMILTRHMVLEWFIGHKDRLQKVVNARDYDRELIEVIAQLRGIPNKVEILNAMIDVALSDEFYHAKEKMIVKKTVLYWNIDPAEINA